MQSNAFREFKKRMGQANHFLITILIGLDAVKNGAKKDDDFNVCWNPKDVNASVVRSKDFAISSALSWAVDCLDMYLRLCNRHPTLFLTQESNEISETKHSVYRKFEIIIKNHKELDDINIAFVDLLICWRNNMMHFDAENKLLPSSEKTFKINPMNNVVDKFHLDVNGMLSRFHSNEKPTFKELATMFSMTINFVEKLDQLLLENIDRTKYLEAFLIKKIKDNPCIMEWNVFKKNNNIEISEKRKNLKQFFITNGICEDFFNETTDSFFDDVIKIDIKNFITD